jgi:hypothetical protein
MNAVWRESKADGRARLVLLAIADHQGDIGAWPSIRRLAQMVNSSERSVQRDIQYLQKIGELRVEVQNAPTQGQYKSNRYWVTLPSTSSGVTELQSGVTNPASGVTADGVQTLIEPLQETIYSHKEFFTEFWNEYPKRVDRAKALKAFKSALKRAKFEDILAGAIAYRNDPTRKPEFTKYPATWLNADAWENAAALPEVKAANETRRLKEKEASDAYLREQEEIAKQSVPLTPELKKKLGL